MRIDGLNHPKTKALARALDIKLVQAVGHLEFLFAFTAKHTPQGDIGKWGDGVIADEAHWEGDAGDFIKALINEGWLDENSDHRLLVHDWKDHAPAWVRANLKKTGREFIDVSSEPSSDASSESTSEASSEASSAPTSSVAKRSVGNTPPKSPSRGTQWDDRPLSKEWCLEAEKLLPDWPREEIKEAYAEFSDYWRGVPGAKGRKKDWLGTWRNRCRAIKGRRKPQKVSAFDEQMRGIV